MCRTVQIPHLKKTKLYRNLKYTQVSKLLLTQSVQNKTFTGKLLLTCPYCGRERERKTAEDVKNSQGVLTKHLLWQAGRRGAVRCWSPDMHPEEPLCLHHKSEWSGSYHTFPQLSPPGLNPAFLPDTALHKQSSQFPPLSIGKGDGLSWKNLEASQESFRSLFFSFFFSPTRLRDGSDLCMVAAFSLFLEGRRLMYVRHVVCRVTVKGKVNHTCIKAYATLVLNLNGCRI